MNATHVTGDGDRRYDGTGHLTGDEYLGVVSAGLRRATLEILSSNVVPIELDQLAATVAAREAERGPADPETVSRVARLLHHQHLPKLDALGVVRYDPRANRVRPRP